MPPNYVMLVYGEPSARLRLRHTLVQRACAKPPPSSPATPTREKHLMTLDGVERTLDDETIVVADTAGTLSLAGVNGRHGERGHRQQPATYCWKALAGTFQRAAHGQPAAPGSEAGYRFAAASTRPCPKTASASGWTACRLERGRNRQAGGRRLPQTGHRPPCDHHARRSGAPPWASSCQPS